MTLLPSTANAGRAGSNDNRALVSIKHSKDPKKSIYWSHNRRMSDPKSPPKKKVRIGMSAVGVRYEDFNPRRCEITGWETVYTNKGRVWMMNEDDPGQLFPLSPLVRSAANVFTPQRESAGPKVETPETQEKEFDFDPSPIVSKAMKDSKVPAVVLKTPVEKKKVETPKTCDLSSPEESSPEESVKGILKGSPSSSTGEPGYCYACANQVCIVDQYMDEIWEFVDTVTNGGYDNPREARFRMYKYFYYLLHGHGVRGNRVELPACITHFVRGQFPDPEGNYTSFRSTDHPLGSDSDSDGDTK